MRRLKCKGERICCCEKRPARNLRHHAITELAESQANDSIMREIAGHDTNPPKDSAEGTQLIEKTGGAEGIRTLDLLDAIEARSQLRHGPTGKKPNSFYNTQTGERQTTGKLPRP
jgi:hypothetical protein